MSLTNERAALYSSGRTPMSATPGWYRPVNRGLEIKIAEKLDFLKRLDEGYK